MKKTMKILKPALICLLLMTVLCGILYTGVVTGIAQLIFPFQANGSVISVAIDDTTHKDFGSELMAQEFSEPKYLIGRPLGTTNLSPTSEEQKALVQERIDWWHTFDPDNSSEIPTDLVMASASGVDPNISPTAADYQISRIAKVRGIEESAVKEIVAEYTTGRFLGFIGEPAVNVLQVNLALDDLL